MPHNVRQHTRLPPNIESGFQPRKLIVASGHMVDLPDRPHPRFPPSKEHAVREHLAQPLERWDIGPGDLGICGGARGGDILFAECCLARGALVWLFLALPEEQFVTESVRLPGSTWEQRFVALRQHPRVTTYFLHEQAGARPELASPFAQNNVWIIDVARALAPPGQLYAILVWDERPTGDGPGGASHFAQTIQTLGGHLAIINPTTL